LIPCQLFPVFLISSGIWPNHLILSHLVALAPLHFNCYALLGILVLYIPFTWPNHGINLFSNWINKFCFESQLLLRKFNF
jgi:hypothetical protein